MDCSPAITYNGERCIEAQAVVFNAEPFPELGRDQFRVNRIKNNRHPDAGGEPFLVRNVKEEWVPAFTGMTII